MNKTFDEAVRRRAAGQTLLESEETRAHLDGVVRQGRAVNPESRPFPLRSLLAALCALVVVLACGSLLRRPSVYSGEDRTNAPGAQTLEPLCAQTGTALPLAEVQGGFTLTVEHAGYTADGQLVLGWSLEDTEDVSRTKLLVWSVDGAEDARQADYGSDGELYPTAVGTAQYVRVWPDAPRLDRTLTLNVTLLAMDAPPMTRQQWAETDREVLTSEGQMDRAAALTALGYGTVEQTWRIPVTVAAGQVETRTYGLGRGCFDLNAAGGDCTVQGAALTWEGVELRLDMDVTNTGTAARVFTWSLPELVLLVGEGLDSPLLPADDGSSRTLAPGESVHITAWYAAGTILMGHMKAFRLAVADDAGMSAAAEIWLQPDCHAPAQTLLMRGIPQEDMTQHPVTARVWQAEAVKGRTTVLMDFFCDDLPTILNWRAEAAEIMTYPGEYVGNGSGSVAESRILPCSGGWHAMYQWETDQAAPEEGLWLNVRRQGGTTFTEAPDSIYLSPEYFVDPARTSIGSPLSLTVAEAGYDAQGRLIVTARVGDTRGRTTTYFVGVTAEGLPEGAVQQDPALRMMNVVDDASGFPGFSQVESWTLPVQTELTFTLRLRAWRPYRDTDPAALLRLTPDEAAQMEENGLTLVSDQRVTVHVSPTDRAETQSVVGTGTIPGFTAEGLRVGDVTLTRHAGAVTCEFSVTNEGADSCLFAWELPRLAALVQSLEADGTAGEQEKRLAAGETRTCRAALLFTGEAALVPMSLRVAVSRYGQEFGSSGALLLTDDMADGNLADTDRRLPEGDLQAGGTGETYLHWQVLSAKRLGDSAAVLVALTSPDGNDAALNGLSSVPAGLLRDLGGAGISWHVYQGETPARLAYAACTIPEGAAEVPLFLEAPWTSGKTMVTALTAQDFTMVE